MSSPNPNANLQNAHATAAQPLDPEKARELGTPPSYHAVYQPVVGVFPQDRPRHARRRRFWHFTACALLLLFFWHPVVLSVSDWVKSLKSGHPAPVTDSPPSHSVPMARPSDCADNVNWQYDGRQARWDWPYHAHASLTLPVDAEELLFLAQGSLAHGSFEISHDGDVSEHATVNIDVAYKQESALNDATVCRLRQTHNTHGLGIFTSHWRHDPDHERQLRFHVHVRLPATSSGELLELKKLRTDLPNFSQHLGELGQTTHFKTVELHASNGNLRADYLYANAAKLQSTNGGVHGVFNVSDILVIHTANGAIDVQANLLNEGERDTTKVSLETTNGAIHGNLGLFRPESTHTGGKYQANARSSNGPVVLAVHDAPANSLLNASVSSTNAPVRVRAPAAYEGSFELRSAFWAPPEVERHEREDPLGRGRRREVSVRSIQRRAVRGEVAWVPGDDDAKSGHIWLETTNARAVLEL